VGVIAETSHGLRLSSQALESALIEAFRSEQRKRDGAIENAVARQIDALLRSLA
jgi:hypothetical protein